MENNKGGGVGELVGDWWKGTQFLSSGMEVFHSD